VEQPNYRPGNPSDRSRFRIERVLIPLIFAGVVLSILADQIPAFHDAKEQMFHPAEYQARKACHAAALAAAERPAYARIVAPGQVHATQGANYVKGVRVGEMGPTGNEVTYGYSCYVDPDGKVVKTNKQSSPTAGG
jgi:hypothetical protein